MTTKVLTILVVLTKTYLFLGSPCAAYGSQSEKEAVWPPRGALHKDYNLTRMGPEVALRAVCGEVPVWGFGYSYIYGVSPDFEPGLKVQANNDQPVRKIIPKKSWEITDNRIGATPPRMPRTARSDFQPLLGVQLIDGDPQTHWFSRGQNEANVSPEWARIDLARETLVKRIVLVPRQDKQGIPEQLTIRVSQDGCNWRTIYDGSNHELLKNAQPQEFALSPQRVKQIWILGNNLPLTNWNMHAFSLSEVEVFDEKEQNVALLSRGAGITVSSFESAIASQRETHRALWPVHYDLGVEWIRINYAGSVLNWRIVEREKGVYEIDPEADAAINDSIKNGCKIIFGLGFTNWLYASEKEPEPSVYKQMAQTNEFSVPLPRADSEEMLQGFKNFVCFMVEYYKDRIDYFEIWNEQSNGYGGWYDAGPELFTRWVKEVSPIIKSIDPDAKVVMGSLSGLGPMRHVGLDWLKICLEQGIAPYIDAIGWHGYYGAAPGRPEWDNFVKDVQETKQLAESHGFRGEYLHSEWCIFAPYPDISNHYLNAWVTELVKAKHMARFAVMNLGMDVMFFWNETWCDSHIDRDVGLFRNTFAASPMSPSQPQPAYYVLRTLCTVFDNARPTRLPVEFSNRDRELECWTFELPGGDQLVSVSLTGESKDESLAYRTDIIIPGNSFEKAVATDVLNGTEQNLILRDQKSDSTVIPDILIKDYPIVIRLSK